MGASQLKREYAFIETASGEDLGEMLVSRGMARSFGQAASPPGEKSGALRSKYDRLEAKAKRALVGAWGDGAGTPTMELANHEDRPQDKASAPTSEAIVGFGDLTFGATEDEFRRLYPQAQRDEDWQSDTETLHTYSLLPPDSIDADRVRFIFRNGRLIQMDHDFGKKRLDERGGEDTDGEALSQMFGNEGEPYEPDALGPKVKFARKWTSPATKEAATLEVYPDGSAQVSFHRTGGE